MPEEAKNLKFGSSQEGDEILERLDRLESEVLELKNMVSLALPKVLPALEE